MNINNTSKVEKTIRIKFRDEEELQMFINEFNDYEEMITVLKMNMKN